ncbi:MAG: PocR ligand-binding domain-containing protein [Verrucomicrobiales bacterium]|nr:PocR ligand-binding domain-containing protein [Verrucomicrobiales bacterium]
MSAFDQLISLPGLRRLFDLAWRTFGVNPALVSMDGERVAIFDREARAQPFCGALNQLPRGRELCAMCDQGKFLEARRDGQTLRYRCHAGLREFVIPVIRDGQTIAFLQCGQVHDRVPSAAEWREATKSLRGAGIRAPGLRSLFQHNRVLSPDQQDDLLELLALIADRLAYADQRELRAAAGQTQAALGRAMTYIETHLGEPLSVQAIAHAANLSTRTLMRLFRKDAGTSVVEFILRRRVARARQLLLVEGRTCAEIGFECGFGSMQHFNRIFRRYEETSPSAWRRQARLTALR